MVEREMTRASGEETERTTTEDWNAETAHLLQAVAHAGQLADHWRGCRLLKTAVPSYSHELGLIALLVTAGIGASVFVTPWLGLVFFAIALAPAVALVSDLRQRVTFNRQQVTRGHALLQRRLAIAEKMARPTTDHPSDAGAAKGDDQ
jgi:hypothetical protein